MRSLLAYANSSGLWWVAGLAVLVIVVVDTERPLWFRLLWVPVSFGIVLGLAALIRIQRRARGRNEVVTLEETVRNGLRQTPRSLSNMASAFEVGAVLQGEDRRAHFAAFRDSEGPIHVVIVGRRWPHRVVREIEFSEVRELRKWGEDTAAIYVSDNAYAGAVVRKYFDGLDER